MVVRTISGILGGILAIIVLVFNNDVPMLLNFVISLICILSVYEVFSAMGVKNMFSVMLPSMVFSAVLPLFGSGILWQTIWYIYTLFMFCVMLFFNKTLKFRDIAIIYSVTMLITFLFSYVVKLRDWGNLLGTFYVTYALSIAWMTDVGAYFFGTFFGKTKLCPEISPKKTVAGAIGGALVSSIMSIIVCMIFQLFVFNFKVSMNYVNIVIIAFFGSIVSMIGDLVFSMIKRGYHVKDFGNVIPGHGGILDRFDSVSFVVPFVYFLIVNVGILNV